MGPEHRERVGRVGRGLRRRRREGEAELGAERRDLLSLPGSATNLRKLQG